MPQARCRTRWARGRLAHDGKEHPVPTDDLSSIPGLEDKHLRALAGQQVTDLRSLTDADQRTLYKAMGNIRPRPTLGQISRWQDEASSKLEEGTRDASDWRTAASFAVVFAQRQVGEAWEHRIEVERTEVEPEQDPQAWPGWGCEPVCGWMLGQLDQADSAAREPANGPGDAQAHPAEEPPGPAPQPAAVPAASRAQLHLDSAVIIDATGQAVVVQAGALVANPPTELVAPVRVGVTVSGARPGTQVQAVTRILRPDRPGWNPQDPVVVHDASQAEFDLSRVPPGQYEMSLIAWAPGGAAKPVSVRLPTITIRSGSS